MPTAAGTWLLQVTSCHSLAGPEAGLNYGILILFDNSRFVTSRRYYATNVGSRLAGIGNVINEPRGSANDSC